MIIKPEVQTGKTRRSHVYHGICLNTSIQTRLRQVRPKHPVAAVSTWPQCTQCNRSWQPTRRISHAMRTPGVNRQTR